MIKNNERKDIKMNNKYYILIITFFIGMLSTTVKAAPISINDLSGAQNVNRDDLTKQINKTITYLNKNKVIIQKIIDYLKTNKTNLVKKEDLNTGNWKKFAKTYLEIRLILNSIKKGFFLQNMVTAIKGYQKKEVDKLENVNLDSDDLQTALRVKKKAGTGKGGQPAEFE